MESKNKTKYLEIVILLIIIATVSMIIILGRSYLKNDIPLSTGNDNSNNSISKISKYQVILNNVTMYKPPLIGYIDTRNSTYYIYIKSTDNVINNVTEVINLEYFNPETISYEEITAINAEATKINNPFFNEHPPIVNETPSVNNEENLDDTNETNTNETPDNTEIPTTPENPNNTETPENNGENTPPETPTPVPPQQEITINEQNPTSIYPLNWLDFSNVSFETFNLNTLTNYCNSYNDIDSFYKTTCVKNSYHLRLYNSYNINNINGFVFNTKKFSVTLPVKRNTRLSDFKREMAEKGITLQIVNEIE